ncbi:MAG: YbaB/EbfC family nucleoid-associated protein [Opitutales bacterium]|nr:YbaB/EbfC family nucleoid-associated protein [Opitutales bacterium]
MATIFALPGQTATLHSNCIMAGLGKFMKQMAKLQKKMGALQEELAEKEITVSSGGGAVEVTISLQQEMRALKIDPEFLKEDPEMVQETILEAVKEAYSKSSKISEEAMQAISQEMQMAGMPGM